MTKEEIAAKAKKVRGVYRDFLFRLFKLEKKESDIIRTHTESLDTKKLEEIRKQITTK